MDIWVNGIVSGIVASIFFSGFLLFVKPAVKISNKVSLEKEKDGSEVYRIKVVNKTWAMITNLKYTLHYCQMHGDGIETITEIMPRKSAIISISRFRFSKKKTDYAVRLSYLIDKQEYPLDENNKLVFTFIADHALSTTTRCIKKEYKKDDIITGIFETGTSTKILRSR